MGPDQLCGQVVTKLMEIFCNGLTEKEGDGGKPRWLLSLT
uniref:Uncharacterized protein n=1 Tax=Anguilla anguilla TaxID=7936 RepID=A0A0E9QT99_ANGAN